MVYTEIKEINGKKYYYRAVSIRKGKKVSKKRVYLGNNLSDLGLKKMEDDADKKLIPQRIKKRNREIEKIKSKIVGILKANKVKRAGIFGSYARGEERENSDVDILIEIEPNHSKTLSLLDIIRLQHLLEYKIGKKVDLVEYPSINRLIKDRVLKEEIKII